MKHGDVVFSALASDCEDSGDGADERLSIVLIKLPRQRQPMGSIRPAPKLGPRCGAHRPCHMQGDQQTRRVLIFSNPARKRQIVDHSSLSLQHTPSIPSSSSSSVPHPSSQWPKPLLVRPPSLADVARIPAHHPLLAETKTKAATKAAVARPRAKKAGKSPIFHAPQMHTCATPRAHADV
jgi:hypothetical protein